MSQIKSLGDNFIISEEILCQGENKDIKTIKLVEDGYSLTTKIDEAANDFLYFEPVKMKSKYMPFNSQEGYIFHVIDIERREIIARTKLR